MVKNGITTTVNTRHQSVTVMKEYEAKSFEVSCLSMYCTINSRLVVVAILKSDQEKLSVILQ
jgi:hypothetical protein